MKKYNEAGDNMLNTFTAKRLILGILILGFMLGEVYRELRRATSLNP